MFQYRRLFDLFPGKKFCTGLKIKCLQLNLYKRLNRYKIDMRFHSFQLWEDLFSNNTKQCEEYKKLTFYLHVHFAILPKRKLGTDQYKKREKYKYIVNNYA